MNTNIYGDQLTPSSNGRGVNISNQRLDELDLACISFISRCKSPPVVMELGCGQGGLTKKMAKFSSEIIAFDLLECGEIFHEYENVIFHRDDIVNFCNFVKQSIDIFVSQRTLHYLKYESCLRLLKEAYAVMRTDGMAYLSVSGVASELGVDYERDEIERRFYRLSHANMLKHGIKEKVCLYELDEFSRLVSLSGFDVLACWRSKFGNVKLIAKK